MHSNGHSMSTSNGQSSYGYGTLTHGGSTEPYYVRLLAPIQPGALL